ncbi:TetR/AcrR family transcriptional regulator [Spirillospora sp. NPDC050679]
MPIFVDHDERRQQIMDAAARVLGEGGFARFSLRAVGARQGGSVTLVTHYFPGKEALLAALLDRSVEQARALCAALSAIEDPRDRLETMLGCFLLVEEAGRDLERARIALAAHGDREPAIAEYHARIEPAMREVIRRGLQGLVAPDRLDAAVDMVRLWTSGLALSVVEHPETWTAERQSAALEHFTRALGLPDLLTV